MALAYLHRQNYWHMHVKPYVQIYIKYIRQPIFVALAYFRLLFYHVSHAQSGKKYLTKKKLLMLG